MKRSSIIRLVLAVLVFIAIWLVSCIDVVYDMFHFTIGVIWLLAAIAALATSIYLCHDLHNKYEADEQNYLATKQRNTRRN